ncbi:MAG TPA: Rieske (2Fe-2S) protein [Bacteroidia bacterium]|jgi:cytochrome b6-f complex iron-sulfur subunit|nr:Rieske (2Fe-2S) protein [Bacteroidia bacterium]
MTRKEFIAQVGGGSAALFFVACAASCKKKSSSSPQGPTVNFTVNVSSGPLATNGGSLVQSGVIVARTLSGGFIAVAAACTHQGVTINYVSGSNSFSCPGHGATFDSGGNVTGGPAPTALKKYNTSLSGNILTVSG